MSNLLPITARKATWGLYRSHFLTTLALALVACALFASLALLPAYLALTFSGEVPTPSTADKATQEDRLAIARTQVLITTLSPLLSRSSPTALVSEAIALRPAGVSITHIVATAGAPGTIILSGTASALEEINSYQQALRGNARFKAVSVPVGDLAGTGDGRFSITISTDF